MKTGISIKVGLTYMAIILTTLLCGVFSIYVVNQSNKSNTNIRYNTLPFIEKIKEIRFMMQDISRLTNNWIYFNNERDAQRLKSILQTDYPEIEKELQNDLKNIQNGEDSRLTTEIINSNKEIIQTINDITAILATDADFNNEAKVSKARNKYEKEVLYNMYNANLLYRELLNSNKERLNTLQDELEDLHTKLYYVVIGMILIVLIISIASLQYTRFGIVHPIIRLKNIILEVSKGNIHTLKQVKKDDEVGEMHSAIAEMITDLQRKITFSEEIGKNNFDSEFTLISNQDKLGKALIEMRDNLKQSAESLKNKVNEIENINRKQDILLEKSGELITVFSTEMYIKYQSPSINNILGYEPDELDSLQFINKIHPEDLSVFKLEFDNTKRSKGISKNTFRIKNKTEQYIWLETSFSNQQHTPGIEGILMNSRDVTIARIAEKEQNLRSKMQALSENSPDIILRIDAESYIYYSNPAIKKYTTNGEGKVTDIVLADTGINPDIKESIEHLRKKLLETGTKQEQEIVAEWENRKTYFSAKAIPETGENGKIETILIILHDITGQKLREKEITEINIKIQDSINYSHRIQSSLLPGEAQLNGMLEDTFIYYKPKDVVSGDFPFYYAKNKHLYIAAVDCTGHGVPGALMSLIGYFLLEQIMTECDDDTPASEILDALHSKVQYTLKQDSPDSITNDGMDIALLKINIENYEVNFAGAHRPLYYISNGKIEEIKADRYPVGGIQYRNRKPFTNHSISMKKGDRLFINTDGITDQFGGPEGKERFMSRRVKELIEANMGRSMQEMKQDTDHKFTSWKGTNKQIDDVLLIGITI